MRPQLWSLTPKNVLTRLKTQLWTVLKSCFNLISPLIFCFFFLFSRIFYKNEEILASKLPVYGILVEMIYSN